MSLEITLVVLFAAILHAGWNAVIKISGDRVAVMAIVALFGSVVSVLALPFVSLPDPASWPLLGFGILLHTAYCFVLPLAYNHGDFGQVYPIARGSAPLLVAIGAAFFAGEVLTGVPLWGVVFLSAGVMALAFDRRAGIWRNPRAVILALVTGACIAAYTLVDGIGARQSGSAFGFAVCLTLGDGILAFLIAWVWKRRVIVEVARANLRPAALAATMQVGAYWIIIWVMAHAPLAMVSALRETGVLFAALISTFLLKEGFGVWRFVSAGLIACGIGLTRYKP